jgi:hypothetical protein
MVFLLKNLFIITITKPGQQSALERCVNVKEIFIQFIGV